MVVTALVETNEAREEFTNWRVEVDYAHWTLRLLDIRFAY